jgi:hypothetical protein
MIKCTQVTLAIDERASPSTVFKICAVKGYYLGVSFHDNGFVQIIDSARSIEHRFNMSNIVQIVYEGVAD